MQKTKLLNYNPWTDLILHARVASRVTAHNTLQDLVNAQKK